MLLSATYMLKNPNPKEITKDKYILNIKEHKTENKNLDLKLKDIIVEIGNPISMNIKDYIENINEFSESTIKSFKLDTSMVNVNEAKTYTYTISYKKKKYNGNIIVKEEELPNLELTLKNLNLEKNSVLSNDIKQYINESISDKIKNNIVLNLNEVNTSKVGEYQYSIDYNKKTYTGIITIYEKQITMPNTKTEK